MLEDVLAEMERELSVNEQLLDYVSNMFIFTDTEKLVITPLGLGSGYSSERRIDSKKQNGSAHCIWPARKLNQGKWALRHA